jgi:hypothetical protein
MKAFITYSVVCLLPLCAMVNAQEANVDKNNVTMMDHSHMPIAAPEHAKPMALSLVLIKDTMSGYNLTLKTQHYLLTPPPSGVSMQALMVASIDRQSKLLAGHAHLYVNGEKIQRIYGQDVHLPQSLFKEGMNSISVTLNNHGHMYWTIDGKKVVSTLYIDSSTEQLIKHQFDSFPATSLD